MQKTEKQVWVKNGGLPPWKQPHLCPTIQDPVDLFNEIQTLAKLYAYNKYYRHGLRISSRTLFEQEFKQWLDGTTSPADFYSINRYMPNSKGIPCVTASLFEEKWSKGQMFVDE